MLNILFCIYIKIPIIISEATIDINISHLYFLFACNVYMKFCAYAYNENYFRSKFCTNLFLQNANIIQ